MPGGPGSLIAVAIYDPAAVQVVRGELNSDSVPGRDPDAVSTHPACGVGDQFVTVFQRDLEHHVGQSLPDNRVEDDRCLLLKLRPSGARCPGAPTRRSTKR